MRIRTGTIAKCLILLSVVLSAGCETEKKLALGEGCALNSDCSDPLACKFGKCHRQCDETRDCPTGERCVKVEDMGVCQLDGELACDRQGACPDPLQCSPDDQCLAACDVSDDCLGDQTCKESFCVESAEAMSTGRGSDAGSSDAGGTDGEGTSDSDAGEAGAPIDPAVLMRCENGSKDVMESDVDCGGPCPRRCDKDKVCGAGADCASGVCDVVCQAPSCTDKVKNGSETDLDCGGTCFTPCQKGAVCKLDADCATSRCLQERCVPVTCPSEPGVAAMVPMPGGYCIDSTEVTRTQYEAWLTKNPSTQGQIKGCEGNTAFADATCSTQQVTCKGAACGDHPQTCVDWCDAVAYCAAVGKRLCGKIGGGPISYGSFSNASLSQWYAACSSGGLYDTPPAMACNFSYAASPSSGTRSVGSSTACQPMGEAYKGVFDLLGNVAEWVDTCSVKDCLGVWSYVGGYWTGGGTCGGNPAGVGGAGVTSSDPGFVYRSGVVGFRCCSQ